MRCSEPSGVSWRPSPPSTPPAAAAAAEQGTASGSSWARVAEEAGLVQELEPEDSAVLWQAQLDWLAGRGTAATAATAAGQQQEEEEEREEERLVCLAADFRSACAEGSEPRRVRAAVALGRAAAATERRAAESGRAAAAVLSAAMQVSITT